MILPTMTPEEKVAQMEKVLPTLKVITEMLAPHKFNILRRAKTFPAYVSLGEHEIEGMGKWTIILEAEEKGLVKKGIASMKAYQTYYVSGKNPVNNGAGVYMFNTDARGKTACHEYPPHYFNRIRERLIDPRIEKDFKSLIKEVMKLHDLAMDETVQGFRVKNIDGKYHFEQDHSIDRKEGYYNLVTYHKKGISLGVSGADRRYFNFTTFVPNSMLREEQREAQEKRMRELLNYAFRRRTDPNAKYNNIEWV